MVLSLCVKLFTASGPIFTFVCGEVFVCWPVCFGFFCEMAESRPNLDRIVLDAGQQLNSGDLFMYF